MFAGIVRNADKSITQNILIEIPIKKDTSIRNIILYLSGFNHFEIAISSLIMIDRNFVR
jgi:hypothetical protein